MNRDPVTGRFLPETDIQDTISRRLKIPATPSEIASGFDISLRLARAYVYQLKRQGKAVRLDRRVPRANPRGRQWEWLWQAT